jgi:hypothetical protein
MCKTLTPSGLSASGPTHCLGFGVHRGNLCISYNTCREIESGEVTSVGSNAIQLAVAAGYEVFITTSPKNFDYVKSLGAT